MRLNLLIILLSFASLGSADINETRCESTSLSGDSSDIPDNDSNVYVMCSGNFTDMKKLKESLESIKYTITAFELQNALLDALPPDVFHYVRKPSIQKITFRNVKMGLLGIPDLGSPPFKTVKDTVESLEIHNCSSVFAWNLKSLDLEHLKTFIVEDSDVTAITHTLIMWPNLRFIQLVHTGIYWIHNEAFQHNKKLTICSLAYNKIKLISRNLFPKPASFLYSIDFSFNKLLWLPEDVFSDMNVLQELKLDNNNLIHVSFKLLSPTWSNLTQLWLHAALKDIIEAFSLPSNVARLNEAKSSAGNDMILYMQLVFPLATQIQLEVIQNYDFTPDKEGLLQFTNCIKLLRKENLEVSHMDDELRQLLLPPLTLPYPQTSAS